MCGVLSAYRVIDFTDAKGAFCTRLLASMGARVVRIEEENHVIADHAEDLYLNSGKERIPLSLETESEREKCRDLIRTADILVESEAPGRLKKLGLDYPCLSRINPGLIMASITEFGQSGPYRDYRSCPLVAAALGGAMSVCGAPGTPPLQPFGSQAYYTASLFAANGVLLALWRRHASGRGQHIDISVMECVAATLDHILVRYFTEGVVAKRNGSLYWNNAFRIFPCRDGYVLLSLLWQWETLVEWLESEGMAEDLVHEKYRQREERLRNVDHVIAVLEKWTQRHTAAEIVEKGQLMHFPWAKVNSIADLRDNRQLQERGFFLEAEDTATGRKYQYPRLPWLTLK